ncbi:PhoX family protein [Kallotenue papyrolyticum]|uniref:PhoX family protein n=1 Tax=Kallotenue papyrolyticum TaxID=1325125 RepID=UPI0004BA3B77|nr:alkaline phosphatase PhoX [Kallotenue papyrolyticum]
MTHQPDRLWHRLLEARLSRRAALKGSLAAAGAAMLPLDLRMAVPHRAAPAAGSAVPAALTRPPFRPIRPTTADDVVLPRGYRYTVVRIYGDEIAPGQPFGYNADYIGYFPIDLLEGGRSSVDGLLTVNHEYTNPLLQYGYSGGPKSAQQIRIERESVGLSVFRVQRQRNGRWAFVQDGHNRRVTGYTTCRLTGPVAGTSAVFGATEVTGSVGNCSGGMTPWGTVLSCEENVDEYGAPVTTSFGGGWDNYTKEHHGWVVEVDPFNPNDVPRKHTAMGRFRHENVAVMVSPSGRVVCYMGDDKNDSCVYKFVSEGAYDPRNREANLRLLERGKLYAADFANGKWLLLDYASQKALREATKSDGTPLFRDQADVLADARAAALALKATPVDRPEDIEIHPLTGHVYIALTNNTAHGNFHGQIVRLIETDHNPEALTFDWEFFAVGGPQSGFSSPDNLIFDPYGNLWMVTDISSSRAGKGIYRFHGNNAMFFFATEGPDAGKAYQFASGPVECEMTGPMWTPDGTTLFLAIQHPGEESPSLNELTSHWPNLNGDPLPRPGVIAITGFPGWRGQRSFLPF